MLRNRGDGFGLMRFTLPLALPLLAWAVLGMYLAQPSAAAEPAISQHEVKADPGRIAESWSRSDLLSAEPAEMPAPAEAAFLTPHVPDANVSAASGPFFPADVNALPERLHGKVFFEAGANRFQCSGTLVSSRRGNVVLTAAHCVWDVESGKFVTNLVFIPGYENGSSRFTTYPATRLAAPSGYTESGNFSYDIGLVALDGNPEADLGGSRQVAFNLDPYQRRFTVYGYPALPDPPYNGGSLAACDSRVALRDSGIPQPMGVTPCDMKQGASGGGWITGGNYLNSVTSYTHCDFDPDLCGFIWGPYFSRAARALYTSPAGGGSVKPRLKLKYRPPRIVRKRKVLFKFAGSGSTPVKLQCRLDRRRFSRCGVRKKFSGLNRGRHVLRVRAVDQTGRKSRAVSKAFRVVLKRR